MVPNAPALRPVCAFASKGTKTRARLLFPMGLEPGAFAMDSTTLLIILLIILLVGGGGWYGRGRWY